MSDKIRAALGFAAKAGKIASGEFAVNKAVVSRKAYLIVVDSQASERTKKRWKDASAFYDVKYVEFDDASSITGRRAKVVFAITGKEFSDMILNELNIDTNDNASHTQNTKHGGVY